MLLETFLKLGFYMHFIKKSKRRLEVYKLNYSAAESQLGTRTYPFIIEKKHVRK